MTILKVDIFAKKLSASSGISINVDIHANVESSEYGKVTSDPFRIS